MFWAGSGRPVLRWTDRAFLKLAENPYLWQAVDSIRIGYRRSVYVSDSIYYRIDGNTVEIMRILGSQDAKKELE